MLNFSYNVSESCYIEAAKKTFEVNDYKELCEKIDVRFSYGKVSTEEYRNHYDPEFWQLRKVSWILSVPFRLLGAIAAFTESLINLALKDNASSKINRFCTVRLCESAVGALLCIFNDRIGQQWTTDADVHIKFYFLAKQELHLRQKAFNEWFRSPLEILKEFNQNLRDVNNSVPVWVHAIPGIKASIPGRAKAIMPLDRTGGFNNGGNTCYVAAALQSLRQIPIIRERLNESYILTKNVDESEEAFKLRGQIKMTIVRMLEATDRGETILGNDIYELTGMLFHYTEITTGPDGLRPYIGIQSAGNSGDAYSVIEILLSILETKQLEDHIAWLEDRSEDENIPIAMRMSRSRLAKPISPSIIIVKRHINANSGIHAPLTYQPAAIEEATDLQGKKCNYALVSALTDIGHAKAYIKKIDNPSADWVCCNDGSVRKGPAILPTSEDYGMFIYAKI